MVDFSAVARHYQERVNKRLYITDPVMWARERMNVYLWSKQREILQSLVDHKKTAVKTTHSIGKTFTGALATAWWIDTRGTDGIVISSAPTYDQVHGLLWEEIRKFHVLGGLPGRVTQDDRWIMPFSENGRSVDRLVAQGRKPADTNIHAFQGTHRPAGVLVILDEGGGVPESIYTGTEAITTAPMDRILAIGNPDDPNTEFGRIFREAPEDWNLITVSAFDTPNFTGEEIPEYLAKSLPQVEWVESRRKDWGEDSNRYKAKVLAEFPDSSDDGLFNMGQVESAVSSVNIPKRDSVAPVLGVDVARFGTDRTTVFANWAGHVEHADDWAGLDTLESAERIAEIAKRLGAREIRIDAIGVGAGVKDNLVRMVDEHCAVYEMIGNAASPDFNKWYNARAYWYDMLRSRIASGEIDLPEHNQLVDEFRVIRYTLRDTSMLIESKEDMRRRGVKSPDFLDAVIYATADIDGISGMDPEKILGEEELLGDEDWDLYDGMEPWMVSPV